MKLIKLKLGTIVSLLFLMGIISMLKLSPDLVPIEIDLTNSRPQTASIGNPPVVTGLRGGYQNLTTGINIEYTHPAPWESYWEYGMPMPLFWEVDFTNVTIIKYFHYNITYGSLDGLNGSFTPYGMKLTNKVEEPILWNWENVNPENFVDFGHNVTLFLEDEEGGTSEIYTQLFKYHNGTVEMPPEPPEFSVSTPDHIINPMDELAVSYTIVDLEGGQNYSVDMTCNQDISLIDQSVTNISALFNENNEDAWTPGLTYNFSFTLKVWEGASVVSTTEDDLSVYINKPPENGTCTVTPTEGTAGVTTFIVSCMDWEDDLDGTNLHYGIFLISGGVEEVIVSFQSPYLLNFMLSKGNYNLTVRIHDQNGGYTDFALPTINVEAAPPAPHGGVPSGTFGLIWGSLGIITLLMLRDKKSSNIQK